MPLYEFLSILLLLAVCIVMMAGFPVAFSLAGVSVLFALLGWAFGAAAHAGNCGPDWHTVIGEPMDTPANFMLLIENLLDITHFYPLHDGNIGDLANSRIPIELEEGEVDGNHYVMTIRRTKNYTQPPYLVDWFHYKKVDREHMHCMQSPGFTRVVMRNAPPGKLGGGLHKGSVERGYVLMHSHTPVNDRRHIWRWYMSTPVDHMSKGDPKIPTSERAAKMFPDVVAEDHWALEQQQAMFDYPDEGYQEVFLKPDKGLRRARQIIQQMIREEQDEQTAMRAAE